MYQKRNVRLALRDSQTNPKERGFSNTWNNTRGDLEHRRNAVSENHFITACDKNHVSLAGERLISQHCGLKVWTIVNKRATDRPHTPKKFNQRQS